MNVLASRNLEKTLDLLGERLAFERSAVKLYDTIVEKAESSGERAVGHMIDQLREHRDQEREHEAWLEAKIKDLGGHADEVTPMADLVERESQGLEQVVKADDDLSHMCHALLAAELMDTSGWQLLLELADYADDVEARREFKKRLHEEEDHLAFVRRIMLAYARRDVLGRPLEQTVSA